jgi:transposase-like protein
VEQVLNQILQAQAAQALQAQPHERTPWRQGYRNGQRERPLQTRVGTLTLRVPRLRGGQFSPELFERYQRSEQAFVLALMQMVVQGVSTRKVEAVTKELCGAEFSNSTVWALCARLDPLVSAWNERPLSDQRYRFLIVDALVIRVREEARVRPCSALIASGVNERGYRQVLGLQIGDSESQASWSELFIWLKKRGLWGVDLVSSDDHAGLVAAVKKQFQGATWQRCQTHLTGNVLEACPDKERAALKARVHRIFEAVDPAMAPRELAETVSLFWGTAQKAVDRLEAGFADVMAVLSLAERYGKRLRSTNAMERLHEEIRRRERVIRILPKRAWAGRLLGAFVMEHDASWSTGKAYLDMREYWQWREERQKATLIPALAAA